MHSNRKNPWMFGWNPPWHRKNMDRKHDLSSDDLLQQQSLPFRQRNHSARSSTENDTLRYNGNKYNYYNTTDDDNILPTQLDMTTIDTGSLSPPLSSSSSSFTSGTRRNTKASILDFFHRRKSSTPSVMSLQQSLSVAPTTTGHKPIMATNPSSSVYQQSTSYAGHYSLSCSLPTSLSDNAINVSTGSSPPSLHHHRFAFNHHPNETNNSNISSPSSNAASAILEQPPPPHRPSSLLSPPSYHIPSPLSPPPPHLHHHHHHHFPSAIPQPSDHHRRTYATLLKQHCSSLYEQPMGTLMEDSSRPTRLEDDIKRITLGHELVKLALDGSGNGSWCIDCAKENPHSFVLGLEDRQGGSMLSTATAKKMMMAGTSTRLGTSAPTSSPPAQLGDRNYMFIKSTVSLVESLKRFPDNHFDLVYGRFLALSLPRNDYESLVAECWRVCKSGGYVEFTELDLRIHDYHAGPSPLVHRLNQQVVLALEKKNLDPRLPRNLQDLFFKLLADDQAASGRQCSYQVKYNSLPLGVWGGRLGVMFRDDLRDVLEALGVSTGSTGWQASSDSLDDELDAHMAFMNLYQIFVQKNRV